MEKALLALSLLVFCSHSWMLLAQAPDAPLSAGPPWTDAEKEAQRQAALSMVAALNATLKQGAKQFVVTPGNYRFDGVSAQNFRLLKACDFTLEASGATFYFDPHFGVRIQSCRNVTVHGLTVDTDPLPWLQGRIEALNPQTAVVDLALDPGYAQPAPVTYRVVFFDGKTGKRLSVRNNDLTAPQDLGNGSLRLSKFGNPNLFRETKFPRPVEIGDRVALIDLRLSGGNIVVSNCEKVTLNSVTLYGAAGFAFQEAEGAGGNRYIGCKLVLHPDSNRLMASASDGFHSWAIEKGPLIESCEFSHSGDDLLALHGFFSLVTGKTDARNFMVASILGSPATLGTMIHFYRLPNATPIGEATVTALEEMKDPQQQQAVKSLRDEMRQQRKITVRNMAGAHIYHVQVDRDVQADRLDMIERTDLCGAGAVIRGNHLHDGNVRGILVKSRDVTIESNVVERTAEGGIVLEAEAFWLEGPFSRQIKITGNRLSENGWSAFDRSGLSLTMAAIHVGTYFGEHLFPRTLIPDQQNEGIVIKNNKIERPAGPGILVMNTRGVAIEGNQIDAPFFPGENASFFDFAPFLDKAWKVDSGSLEGLKKPYFAIYVQSSSDVQALNNTVTNAPPFLRGITGKGPAVRPAPAP